MTIRKNVGQDFALHSFVVRIIEVSLAIPMRVKAISRKRVRRPCQISNSESSCLDTCVAPADFSNAFLRVVSNLLWVLV